MRIPQISAGDLRRVLGGQGLVNVTGNWDTPTFSYDDPPAVASKVAKVAKKVVRTLPAPTPAARTGGFWSNFVREMFARH